MDRWLLTTLLLAVLTACSSSSSALVPTSAVRLTSLPATETTQPVAPPETGGIDLSSLTGRIVFSAGPGEHQDIYVINADGSDLIQLTTDPAADFDPAWSPDGTLIAFRSTRDGQDEIYLMPAPGTASVPQAQVNADGSGQMLLTSGPETGHSPEWSPDGKVVFP